ncbi:hypothetical protein CLU79DRAFT_395851 [Phycomyces nitens]|nr:hypothetical protein CLU79DRAFT_395851 [Phycomyces nitens]
MQRLACLINYFFVGQGKVYISYNMNFDLAIGRIYFLERVYIIETPLRFDGRDKERNDPQSVYLIAVVDISLGSTLHIFSALTVFSGSSILTIALASITTTSFIGSVIVTARRSVATTVITTTIIVSATSTYALLKQSVNRVATRQQTYRGARCSKIEE